MAAELNARIGACFPNPALPIEPAAARASARPVLLLAAALLAALWPHWAYVARRIGDGSDEPWGVVALLTVIALLVRERNRLRRPDDSALIAAAALALAAAIAQLALPDLAAAAIAIAAAGVFVRGALKQRPTTGLLALMMLSLPLIASLQFYFGFPLRVVAAHGASALLNAVGVEAMARGASLVFDRTVVLIDAPCAGIGMLWIGSYLAALLSYLNRASALQTAFNGIVAGALMLAANIVRNALLFFPESGLVHWPAWIHDITGWLVFTAAVVPLILFTCRNPR